MNISHEALNSCTGATQRGRNDSTKNTIFPYSRHVGQPSIAAVSKYTHNCSECSVIKKMKIIVSFTFEMCSTL